MQKKKKKFSFYLAAFIIFGVIYLLVCEVMMRVFWDRPDPLSMITQTSPEYLITPNRKQHNVSSVGGEFEYNSSTNQYGYRGKNFSVPKEDGVIRIFAVGDSFTFGVGAENDQTIPALLEQGLNKQYGKIEVVNAGAGHASPITHYVNLKYVHLKYEPDLIVLLFDMTDLVDDWRHERNAVYDDHGDIVRLDPLVFKGKTDWVKMSTYYSSFCKYLHRKVWPLWRNMYYIGPKAYFSAIKDKRKIKADIINVEGALSDEAMLEYDALLMLRDDPWKKPLINQAWKRTSGYLRKIHQVCKDNNIPLVLVAYPHGTHVGRDQWKEGRKTWGFEDKKYTDYYAFELLKNFANEENIPFINTLEDFLTAPKKKYFFDWDGHMTTDGYRLVTDGILKDRNLHKIIKELKQK